MQSGLVNANRKVRTVFSGLLLVIGTVFVAGVRDSNFVAQSQTRPPRRAVTKPAKYSAFPHNAAPHRLECSSCHKFPSSNWNKVRSGPDAFPDITDYPKHDSCVGCHRQQFFRGARPTICSICHTNPGPRGGSRHPFPNPRAIFDQSPKGKTAESDFQIRFPHDKHIDIVTGLASRPIFRNASLRSPRRSAEESCAVCHATLSPQGNSDDEFATKPPASLGDAFWLKKGTFKSTPTSHTTCFTCHSQDSGIEPTPMSCGTCHSLKQPLPPADFDAASAAKMGVADRITLDAWRRRDSSGKFRHEFQSHSELSCDTCHNVATMNTLDAKTKRVAVSSCAMCHVTATVDDGGAVNYEVAERKKASSFECTKCHVIFGRQPVPQSHIQAIIDAGGKP